DLERMMLFKFEENLSAIAGGLNLADTVVKVLLWAEKYGKIEELITKAHESNPSNPELKAFFTQYQALRASLHVDGSSNDTSAKLAAAGADSTDYHTKYPISRKTALYIADAYVTYFCYLSDTGWLVSNRLYKFVYAHDFPDWFCNQVRRF